MIDVDTHVAIFKLIIGYTLVGAFLFTVVVTCLSLVGIIRFANSSQQRKLFTVLVVELVAIALGAFSNLLVLSPRQTQVAITQPLVERTAQAQGEAKRAQGEAERATSKLQSESLKGLVPEAAALAEELLRKARGQGIQARVISGYRSREQQLALYERHVTMAKVGTHNTGRAFDIGIFEDGKYLADSPKYEVVGALGKEIGLVWGGDNRSFADKPHFETADAQASVETLKLGCPD
jgi:peptidoglycan L-alanyl-D-glutamate endopeptidase CwlK